MTDTPTLTLSDLRALHPCRERLDTLEPLLAQHGDQPINARQAVETGATLGDLVWAASAVARQDPDVRRRLRLWCADCMAHVLPIYECQVLGDRRVRDAIEAARAFARGQIDAIAAFTAGEAGEAALTLAASSAADNAAEESWQLERLVLWLTDEPNDWPLNQKEEADAA